MLSKLIEQRRNRYKRFILVYAVISCITGLVLLVSIDDYFLVSIGDYFNTDVWYDIEYIGIEVDPVCPEEIPETHPKQMPSPLDKTR